MEPLPPAEAEAADMLSSLPAHLLDEILTRLDLRDVVRTSVLSCVWRRRWESLPGLALCFPKGTRPSVIARVLLRYTGPSISRFASYVVDDDDVDDWVIALSHRSVESISIVKEWGKRLGHLTLHSSIFSCDRLVSLNLQSCGIPSLPRSRFAGFPVLQELYLWYVDFADKGDGELQAIIRGSPLLRVLELVEVFTLVDCVIEAPNLQTLVVDSQDDDGWRFGRLPRLQYAMIDVAEYGHGGHRLLEFFVGVSQVRELIFYLPGNQDEVKIDRIPFTFHNLKSLEISTLFGYMEPILLLFSLLRSSPNL
ncbi:F-box/FBD/LRR-repeat protein At1g13570-like isoform X2 [Miscanthus floridulus]|uniref:F-box/FBD/LRR-repeat protein At1g13570-like isoform X2 n=1 Tax=Miscanthus floridulus TaxID=154761 RepID=UPI003459264F